MKSTPSELNSGGTISAIQVLASSKSRATMMNCGITHDAIGQRDRAENDRHDRALADELVARQRPAGHRGQQHRQEGVGQRHRDRDADGADEIRVALQIS